MVKHSGLTTLTLLLLISCAQQPDSSSTASQKTALVQDAKGRLFSLSCLQRSGAASGLNTDCQTDFSTRGIVKNGRGFDYGGMPGAPLYSSNYFVVTPPTFNGNFCNAMWGVSSFDQGSCYNTFGFAPPTQPASTWGYNSACDPNQLFSNNWNGYMNGQNCGYNYYPQQQPPPPPPYYPGGWGYGGSGYNYGGSYNSGGGYNYGAPIPIGSGNVFAGTYSGQCTTHYKDATPGQCQSTLIIDGSGNARIPGDGGCFSPVDLTGQLQPGSISLTSGGWAAQPSGQTLNLMLSPPGGIITASGSGGGISDTAYTYECSYQKTAY